MAPSDYYKEYQKNEVSTSNQGKLVLMMYDGALKFTRLSLQYMDAGDIAGKSTYLRKAQDIVNELSLSLNMDKGGEIAQQLESLYRFVLNQMTLATIKNDRAALETVLKVLEPLREAWEQVFRSGPEPSPDSPDSPPPPSSSGGPSIKVRC